MKFPPLLSPDFDVLRQTLAVEPRLAAVDVTHRQPRAIHDGVLVLRHPSLNGGVTVEWGIESVARRHIRCHLVNLQIAHAPAMLGVPHIGIMAYPAILRRPVFLPRRYHIEDAKLRNIIEIMHVFSILLVFLACFC